MAVTRLIMIGINLSPNVFVAHRSYKVKKEECRMAFFDDLGKKLSTAADLVADKAQDLAETGKLNLAISSEEKLVQNWYAEIGKSVYKKEKDNLNSEYAEQCGKITKSLSKIADLEQLLQKNDKAE